jgi:hypothetical protein
MAKWTAVTFLTSSSPAATSRGEVGSAELAATTAAPRPPGPASGVTLTVARGSALLGLEYDRISSASIRGGSPAIPRPITQGSPTAVVGSVELGPPLAELTSRCWRGRKLRLVEGMSGGCSLRAPAGPAPDPASWEIKRGTS